MWNWDQGRLEYFQFDTLRRIALFVMSNDFHVATRKLLLQKTGLPFSAPETHSPWRNYSRILKLTMLISKVGDIAKPTKVAELLSKPGLVTADEYFHFLCSAFTDPSPALSAWNYNAKIRYPLLFSLKYLLSKVAISKSPCASFEEIIGAYSFSMFDGSEDSISFIKIASIDESLYIEEYRKKKDAYPIVRQARESLLVISQISYLHIVKNNIYVSLFKKDASEIFESLAPITGERLKNKDSEIIRISNFFEESIDDINFDFPTTTQNALVESGFSEGNKVEKTHITIERNSNLRNNFFAAHRELTTCDMCLIDTQKKYPWTERVLELHHLLPLSSGTRVSSEGTSLADLVAVCPTCHRAIHRYYEQWLLKNHRIDFSGKDEAYSVYDESKRNIINMEN